MKKAFYAALIALFVSASAFAAPGPVVNEKVLKAFNQTFESAQDVSWSEFQHAYEARFTYNDIVTRVIYDREGTALKTIRYYYEQQLPLSVLTKVKSTYEGQKIYCVTEVATEDRTEYHIVLEDARTWTMILADNGGSITVEKKLNKA